MRTTTINAIRTLAKHLDALNLNRADRAVVTEATREYVGADGDYQDALYDSLEAIAMRRLRNVSESIARSVCSVHGFVTKGESDERLTLIDALGMDWDAINQRWAAAE